MSVPKNRVELFEERARAAEELMEVLQNEIKKLAVEKTLHELGKENDLLRTEVASLISQMRMMQKTNEGIQVPKNLKDYRELSSSPASKKPTRRIEAVHAEKEKDIPVNKETGTVKESIPEKINSNKSKRKEEKKDSGGKTKGEKTHKADVTEDQSVDVGKLDFRIGKIVNIKKHPDADSLYVEEIDLGEEKPRTIVSGLVKHVPLEEMQNRMVVVLCNLKPAKMRGVTSEGMVMCASTPEKVEVLIPPQTCVPGDEVVIEGFVRNPEPVLNPKKKIFETVAVDLKTNDEKIATYKGVPLSIAGKGVITAPTLTNVFIK